MPYTPPLGNAANFTATGYYEPSLISHAFKFPVGTYSQPTANAVNFVLASYVYPAGTALTSTVVANPNVEGVGAATIAVTAEGYGEYTNYTVTGDGAATIGVTSSGDSAHGVAGSGAATISVTSADLGAHGVAGDFVGNIGITAAALGTVERYELTGEVRLQGVLVNRQVRAYRRDDGSLVGDGATVAGRFKIHTGFVAREHYVVPIDLDNLAEDWTPPIANRVMSVLAMDSA